MSTTVVTFSSLAVTTSYNFAKFIKPITLHPIPMKPVVEPSSTRLRSSVQLEPALQRRRKSLKIFPLHLVRSKFG